MGTRRKLLCEKNLTREEVEKFRDAIANETMYEMYFDNIRLEEQDGVNASDLEFPPIQYQVGFYLINHLDFHFLYLGNKVKAIYVMGHYDFSGEISKDAEIKVVNFTYSVFWEDFESKQENQDEVSDLSKHVGGDDHLPYATTAFVICIWLGLLCAVIVAYTYLRKYFTRYHSHLSIQAGHCIQLMMIKPTSTAGFLLEKLQGLVMVMRADVLGTHPYLGPSGCWNSAVHYVSHICYMLVNSEFIFWIQ